MVCGDDSVWLLGTEDGRHLAVIPTAGAVRAAPAFAPWDDEELLWLPSHDRQVSVWLPSGMPSQKRSLPEAEYMKRQNTNYNHTRVA